MAAPQESGLDHVVSADGTVIALEQVTDGPQPLVTLPGRTAGRAVWSEAARALDGRFAVWLADRRGKGDSGDTPPYSFHREYEDLPPATGRARSRSRCSASSRRRRRRSRA